MGGKGRTVADRFPGLRATSQAGVTVVGFEQPGELTAAEAPRFQAAAQAAIGGETQAVLDLGLVGFLDSSGLSALVTLNRALSAQGGELRLAAPGREVVAVLELTRLHRLFEIYDTVDDAVRSFQEDA